MKKNIEVIIIGMEAKPHPSVELMKQFLRENSAQATLIIVDDKKNHGVIQNLSREPIPLKMHEPLRQLEYKTGQQKRNERRKKNK